MNEQQIRKRKEMALIRERREQVMAPIVEEARRLGYEVDGVTDLMHMRDLDPRLLPVFLNYVGKTEGLSDVPLAHAITSVRGRMDPDPLMELFENVEDKLRWYIGNTIADVKLTRKIDDWLENILLDSKYGTARGMLCVAAARHMDKRRAEKLLMRVYKELPSYAPLGMKLIGGEETLNFLREQLERNGDCPENETVKAIRRIERRLEREKAKQAENIAPIHKQRDKRDERSK